MNALCRWCGTDEFVEEHDVVNDLAYCTGPGHPEPRMFQPAMERAFAKAKDLAALEDGIAFELGLYDDLPKLLSHGEWADTAVVEYRYGLSHPQNYAWMLDRWGHTAQGPRRYSTTSFVGSTLGDLSRFTNVTYKPGPKRGYWTLEPVPASTVDMSWDKFAAELGIDPGQWPLLKSN